MGRVVVLFMLLAAGCTSHSEQRANSKGEVLYCVGFCAQVDIEAKAEIIKDTGGLDKQPE